MSGPSRRDLLLGRLLGRPGRIRAPAGVAAGGPPRRVLPVLRPPGAVAEADLLRRCDRCLACARACPHGAIGPAPARLREAAGTPRIDPVAAPCHLCPDRPCARACGPGVLRADLPAAMGTARIDPLACLAWRGSFCSACAERCPVAGAVALGAGRPTIDPAACAGCGICQHVCPAPTPAVLLLARTDRAPWAALEEPR